MQLICNELSFYPIAENTHIAEIRFRQFLNTFKEARRKYQFTHVRFPVNHSAQQITITQSFYEWVSSLSNQTLKNLIIGLCRSPYTDDLEAVEFDRFFESNYKISGDGIPTNNEPLGLPIAYIKSLPAISFDSHAFWRARKIQVEKTNGNVGENVTFSVYNVCYDVDLNSQEISEWADNCMIYIIDAKEQLVLYLSFKKYSVVLTEAFMEQLLDWKTTDIERYKYLLLLMKDVELHPFTGGMGQTENLKNRGKEASKRITQADRLSYSLENNVVTFLACNGHYEFH